MKYLLITIGIILYILIGAVFAGIYERKYPGSDQIIFSIVLWPIALPFCAICWMIEFIVEAIKRKVK